MIYLVLLFEFMKIGLFSLGGGLATLPFLNDLANRYDWFTREDIANMLAISESTPGPIGINMSTYAGFGAAGSLGAGAATLGLIVPGIIITTVVCGFYARFRKSRVVEASFYGIRPVVTALICAALFEVLLISVIHVEAFRLYGLNALFDIRELMILAAFIFLVFKFKWHPVIYVAAAGILGIIIGF